jgi:hypothetical protein
VVVIEHNLDVIKTADWVIDLGPEGGDGGGAAGTPRRWLQQRLAHGALSRRRAGPCRAGPRGTPQGLGALAQLAGSGGLTTVRKRWQIWPASRVSR